MWRLYLFSIANLHLQSWISSQAISSPCLCFGKCTFSHVYTLTGLQAAKRRYYEMVFKNVLWVCFCLDLEHLFWAFVVVPGGYRDLPLYGQKYIFKLREQIFVYRKYRCLTLLSLFQTALLKSVLCCYMLHSHGFYVVFEKRLWVKNWCPAFCLGVVGIINMAAKTHLDRH